MAKEEIIAHKDGTAINLFYRNLPCLSVDNDLTYLSVKDRAESLVEINDAMDRIPTDRLTRSAGLKVCHDRRKYYMPLL